VPFYYVSNNKDDLPVRPSNRDEWSKNFHENHIICSTHKRAYESSQHVAVVMLVPPDDVETFTPSHANLHENACKQSGSFWHDKKTEKLFSSLGAENSLILWIKKPKVA